jgi:hypothetical protein
LRTDIGKKGLTYLWKKYICTYTILKIKQS